MEKEKNQYSLNFNRERREKEYKDRLNRVNESILKNMNNHQYYLSQHNNNHNPNHLNNPNFLNNSMINQNPFNKASGELHLPLLNQNNNPNQNTLSNNPSLSTPFLKYLNQRNKSYTNFENLKTEDNVQSKNNKLEISDYVDNGPNSGRSEGVEKIDNDHGTRNGNDYVY